MTVDLFSDTQSLPTREMLDAMVRAEVGDEQRGTDPTVRCLEDRVARLLGHQAAVFLPSGTMCNAIAIRLHIRPGGDEIILDSRAHSVDSEAGGAAALAGASMRCVESESGIFGGEDVERLVRPHNRYGPRSRLVIIEQSTNLGGGRVWPATAIEEVVAVAHGHDLRVHLDGARLLNAAVASGLPPDRFARECDTAWIDFAKGLGCPMGAVLCGSKPLIEEAWRYKQMWGGAMRQTGYLAAACLYALDHHVHRLAEDHARARRFAEGLVRISGTDVDPDTVDTNVVVFRVDDAQRVARRLLEHGIELLVVDERRLRAVTYLGVSDEDVDEALNVIASVVS